MVPDDCVGQLRAPAEQFAEPAEVAAGREHPNGKVPQRLPHTAEVCLEFLHTGGAGGELDIKLTCLGSSLVVALGQLLELTLDAIDLIRNPSGPGAYFFGALGDGGHGPHPAEKHRDKEDHANGPSGPNPGQGCSAHLREASKRAGLHYEWVAKRVARRCVSGGL